MIDRSKAQEAVDYLLGLERGVMEIVRPVYVKFTGRPSKNARKPGQFKPKEYEYVGAEYVQRIDTAPGCDAYYAGEREHTRQSLYLIGFPHSALLETKRMEADIYEGRNVFRRPEDDRDWYVSCYADPKNPKRFEDPEWQKKYAWAHPFGPSFQISPWPHGLVSATGNVFERIDHYDAGKRDRYPFEVEYLDTLEPRDRLR